jgi:hypothetical protein
MIRCEWEPASVPFADSDHPWQTAHPILCSDRRLRHTLGVTEPDPTRGTRGTVRWLWNNRETLALG